MMNMNKMLKTILSQNSVKTNVRLLSVISGRNQNLSGKIVIVGGGCAGCSLGAKLARYFGKNKVIIIEPSDKHYYQPYFTLCGGGIKSLSQTVCDTKDVLPAKAQWLKDSVVDINPKDNSVTTSRGDTVKYDVLIVAAGLELNYDKVPGLTEALEKFDNVGSIYSPKYVEQTYRAIQKFESGDAVYTFPDSSIKCPGAPQKICYIQEDYLRRHGKRSKANVTYNTALSKIFGVKAYADALWKVVKKRDINVNLNLNLIEVKPEKNEATFQNLEKPEEKLTMNYSLLHVTPPMSPPHFVKSNKDLVNENRFVTVNKETLQHTKYPNIFAIGDCTNTPNSKTAAAVASQAHVLIRNIPAFFEGKPLLAKYNGYASCPLVTARGKCIMAEFDYSLQPLESFPFRQDRERYSMYICKAQLLSPLYWRFMLNGYWNGPAIFRKIAHLGMV